MEIYLHIGEENVGLFSAEEVKAKHASGEAGPDTLAWMDGMDTWYPLSSEHFVSLGLSVTVAEPAPVPAAEPEPGPAEPVVPTEAVSAAEPAPDAEPAPAAEPASAEPSPESELVAEDVVEKEPEPDPAEVAATSAAFDAATAFEPRSREELKTEMIRLKQEHANDLLPELGRKAVEEGIRVSGATEIWNRIEPLLKKGDPYQLKQAYVDYAKAIVSAGLSEPALDELIERERRLSEDMLNLHTEARNLAAAKKPGGALKWILLLVALLAVGGVVALVVLDRQ